MGIGLDALTIQEISDEEGYLDALGKRRTAEVQRDAEIGEPRPSATPRLSLTRHAGGRENQLESEA